jgi:hypothetical protein
VTNVGSGLETLDLEGSHGPISRPVEALDRNQKTPAILTCPPLAIS